MSDAKMDYCLRIDVKGDESEFRKKVVEWVSKYGPSIGCYECPTPDNPHYHIWLRSEAKLRAIRENFKYRFPEHIGNGSYSFVCKKGEFHYISKGEDEHTDPVIIINTMDISDEEISAFHKSHWEIKRKIVIPKGVESAKADEDPRSDNTMITLLCHEWERKYPNRREVTRQEVFSFVMDWYHSKTKVKQPAKHYCWTLVTGVHYQLTRRHNPDGLHVLEYKLYEEIFQF